MKIKNLVITGLEGLYNGNNIDNYLLISDWCKYGRKECQVFYQANTLEHPWHNKTNYKKFHKIVAVKSENFLNILKNILNEYHNVNYSVKFWRIFLGRWIYQFVISYYSTKLLIEEIVKKYPGKKFNYIFLKNFDPISYSVSDSLKNMESDQFNMFLFEYLVKENKKFIKYKSIDFNNSDNHNKNSFSLKFYFKKTVAKLNNYIVDCLKLNIVFYDSYFTLSQIFKIAFKSRKVVGLRLKHPIKTYAMEKKSKRIFSGFKKLNDPLYELLMNCIPIVAIEGFNFDLTKIYCPKKIFSSIGDISIENDYSRIWLAHCADNGSKLFLSQHGGVYGVSDFMTIEDIQILNSDLFLSWGWKRKNVKPVTIPNIVGEIKPEIKSKTILIVDVSYPKYYYHMFPSPQSSQIPIHRRNINQISNELSKKTDYFVRIKKYHNQYVWDIPSYSNETKFNSKVKISKNNSIEDELNSSSLVIVPYNSTVHLQSISKNYPTLLYFDKRFYSYRDEHTKLFDKLRNEGILHDSKESLINFIIANSNEIMNWWFSDEVQYLLNDFKKTFCNTSNNWTEDIKKVISNN